MADTTRGAGRLRAWPRKRGRGGTKVQKKNQQNFMNAQRATKYFAPQMYLWFMQQVEDSPLLPRDAMTMMLYNRLYAFTLDTGRTLWPMPAYQDVSQALDVITETPGETIMRGPDGWLPVFAPGPNLATRWTTVMDYTVTDPVQWVVCDTIKHYNECIFIIYELTAESSSRRVVDVSTDDGATWWVSNGDYIYVAASGSPEARDTINLHGSASAGPRTAVGSLLNLSGGAMPISRADSYSAYISMFVATLDPITAIRFGNANNGFLTGGRIMVLAR